jgi:hypothetical protein
MNAKADQFWDLKMFKFLGVILGSVGLAVVGFFIYIANMDARLKILEDRQGTIVEIKADLKELKQDVKKIEQMVRPKSDIPDTLSSRTP